MALADVGHHARRWAPILLVLTLAFGLLTACTKPLPTITVFGNGKSVIVPAASYTFPNGRQHNKITDFGQAPTLKVQPGTRLLVDVPRTVAVNYWLVTGITLDAKSKSTAIPGLSDALRNKHSTRLPAAPAGTTDYYVQVVEYRGSTAAGGWVLHVLTVG